MTISFDKIPKSAVIRELTKETIHKWENKWKETMKGRVTKMFFSNNKDITKIKMTSNFMGKVTGHGETKSSLDRFKIINDPICQCNTGEQTVDDIIYECEMLKNQRQN